MKMCKKLLFPAKYFPVLHLSIGQCLIFISILLMPNLIIQRELEQRAATMGGGNFVVPVQVVTDFLESKTSGRKLQRWLIFVLIISHYLH